MSTKDGDPSSAIPLERSIGHPQCRECASSSEAIGRRLNFGAPATVAVTRTQPSNVPWLQLHGGIRGVFPAPAPATGEISVGTVGGGTCGQTEVTQDGTTVVLDSSDSPPPPGSAHVYRVTASQNGQTFGGYTVVIPG
jgi:hypothetical protein